MKYKRARVAITINDTGGKMIHIGHARTLLLGSLIAREFGCPFHVRLDGIRRHYTSDTTFPVIDLVNCLSFLGIEFDEMYWTSMQYPDLDRFRGELGDDVIDRVKDAFSQPGVSPSEFPAILSDDSLIHHPSLIIRGMEFKISSLYGGVDSNQANIYTATEDMIFEATGHEKHEINTPIIIVDDGNKISKRSNILMHWECLKPMGKDMARKFLIATAIDPLKPLRSMGIPFKTHLMSDISYMWDWNDYAIALRMKEPPE